MGRQAFDGETSSATSPQEDRSFKGPLRSERTARLPTQTHQGPCWPRAWLPHVKWDLCSPASPNGYEQQPLSRPALPSPATAWTLSTSFLLNTD